MNEVKITREQFDHLESIRYDLPQRTLYIVEKIIRGKYAVTEETTYFTYKDKWHYYLVFEADEIPSNKVKFKTIVDRLTEGELNEFH